MEGVGAGRGGVREGAFVGEVVAWWPGPLSGLLSSGKFPKFPRPQGPGPNPKFPTRRSVLILAGGFSDPSAWVPGRLKATQALGCVDSATALSCPKTALARAHKGLF